MRSEFEDIPACLSGDKNYINEQVYATEISDVGLLHWCKLNGLNFIAVKSLSLNLQNEHRLFWLSGIKRLR